MPCATKTVPTAVVVELAVQVRQALRAKIIFAAADGLASAAITRELKVSVNTVRKWLGRFAAGALAALKDAKRPGRPLEF
ncbi:helix-turn-helix domain-containing protein [Streptomyces atratus]|uniref:helix-turn-helix domain-containing protein n=1 Tax=Streptomyces atratus TaxID=1893 RepID=UPI00378C262E